MSALLILAPSPIHEVDGPGSASANLLTPDPREIWTSSSDEGTVTLTVTFSVATTFDTIFLGFAQLSQAEFVQASVGGNQVAVGNFTLPRFSASRPAHALLRLANAVTTNTLRIDINLAAADRPLNLGVLMVGSAFQPTWNHEWGAGRTPIDLGTRTQLQGGGFSIDPGAIKSSWQWSLGDLSDDELDRLYALVMDRGETGPVLVVEDPDTARPGLCERIHYGTFDKLEAYERRDVGLTRWGLKIEDWI